MSVFEAFLSYLIETHFEQDTRLKSLASYFDELTAGSTNPTEMYPNSKEFLMVCRLFPDIEPQEIQHLFKVFQNMPDHLEAVCRVLVNQATTIKNKRKTTSDDQIPTKIPKLETNSDAPDLSTHMKLSLKRLQSNKSNLVVKLTLGKPETIVRPPIETNTCPELETFPELPCSNHILETFPPKREESAPSTSQGISTAPKHKIIKIPSSGSDSDIETTSEAPSQKPYSRRLYRAMFKYVPKTPEEIDVDEVEEAYNEFVNLTRAPRKKNKSSESTLLPTPTMSHLETNQKDEECNEVVNLADTSIEIKSDAIDSRLTTQLLAIFSDACPTYIKEICAGKKMGPAVLDSLIATILESDGNYPKRPPKSPEPVIDSEQQFDILKDMFPDADPDFLRRKCDSFDGNQEAFSYFVEDAIRTKSYPTLKEFMRRTQLSAQKRQYTTEFSVEKFIKVIPNPREFFAQERNVKLDGPSEHYALLALRNMFTRIPIRTIARLHLSHECKFYETVAALKKLGQSDQMKSTRKQVVLPENLDNIPLLQEIAFCQHEQEICVYLLEQELRKSTEREEAKLQGLMVTCECCYDEEVAPQDVVLCQTGCKFCKSCVIKSTEVLFGEGKLDFPCLMQCNEVFSLQTLQRALPPKFFSIVAQKKALAEVKAAGIEDLETCPFCDFATIPPEGDKVFACMNPECMKESCRQCKEPSHIPLGCDEIEKDGDVKARVYVENQMTEALLRKCWKCGIKFFKEEGCNKMACSCGATMCYVCGQKVTDYKHFNGNGGDRYDLCPLYSDTVALNKENVLNGAKAAKAQVGVLKIDPTQDVEEHFRERAQVTRQIGIPPPDAAERPLREAGPNRRIAVRRDLRRE